MPEVKWKISKADDALVRRIVDRAVAEGLLSDEGHRRLNLTMDIEATHLNGCPLRLADLLAADRFNFVHDIVGISRHISRVTGKLQNCFVPRYAKPTRREKALLAKAEGR